MGIFKIHQRDDIGGKREGQLNIDRSVKKLEQYSKALESYNKDIKKLELLMTESMQRCHDEQMNDVNLVLDLKYLKEQGDQLSECLGDLSNVKILELQKQVADNKVQIGEIKNCLEQLQNVQRNQENEKKEVKEKGNSTNRIVKILLFGQLLTIAGLIVMLLWQMEAIVF